MTISEIFIVEGLAIEDDKPFEKTVVMQAIKNISGDSWIMLVAMGTIAHARS